MPLVIVHALEDLPDPCSASIFLAGPTPRDETPSWRPEAIAILKRLGFDGAVIVPEDRDGTWRHSYDHQVTWERAMRGRADLIVFWIPRNMTTMPALTTNVEFGADLPLARVLYGRPDDAPRNRYLDAVWTEETKRPPHSSMETLLAEATKLLGDGLPRNGTDRDIPLRLAATPSFAKWKASIEATGNVLLGLDVLSIVPEGSRHPASEIFAWSVLPRILISDERRIKDNEVVFGRTDSVAIVPILIEDDSASVFLVREFRSAVRNSIGAVVETCGGSDPDRNKPQILVALDELREEMGLDVARERLVPIGTRQPTATFAAHEITAFALRLSADEGKSLRRAIAEGKRFGLDAEEKSGGESLTLIEASIDELSDVPMDWTARGIIAEAIERFIRTEEEKTAK
jgi:8-oxo-dGTP pyrophosphatase MutT (NUDIX family)